MKKYWLLVAMLGAAGCSGAAADEAGSNQAAVSHDGDDKLDPAGEPATEDGTKPGTEDGTKPGTEPDAGKPTTENETKPGTEPANAGEPGTKDPKAGEPAPSCDDSLAAIAKLTEGVTDPEQLALLKQKYEDLRSDCQQPAPSCDDQLALIMKLMIDVTDPEQLALLKNKYEATRVSCEPNVDGNEVPPTKPGTEPSKPEPDAGESK